MKQSIYSRKLLRTFPIPIILEFSPVREAKLFFQNALRSQQVLQETFSNVLVRLRQTRMGTKAKRAVKVLEAAKR